jgi:tetratricopeptide (TPR) repeat protein
MRLKLAGRWDELDAHYQRELRSHRLILPFVMRKYAVPGNLEAGYAVYLYERGRLESALEFTDRAIVLARKPRWKLKSVFGMQPNTRTLPVALNLRVLVLTGLGRYNEARTTAAELRAMLPPGQRRNSADCLMEVQSGHLQEALELAYETLSHNSKDGTARLVASWVYRLRGDFPEAASILFYQPPDVTEHYSPKDLDLVLRSREGVKFVALQRQYAATIHEPIRLLALSGVYLEEGNLDDATQALDTVEPLLGANPVILCDYHRRRAICAAARGDGPRAEQHLAAARSILAKYPKRSTQWETHIAAGRCYLSLQAMDKAGAEFVQAQALCLHPLDKHVTNHWLGRAADAAHRRSEVIRHYKNLVADGIDTKMRQEATETLSRLKGSLT